jgi:hypothetical protein
MLFPLKCGVTPFFMNVEDFLIFGLEKGLMMLFCFVPVYDLREGSSGVCLHFILSLKHSH